MELENQILRSRNMKASDIHITEEQHYRHRVDGRVSTEKYFVTKQEFEEFCKKYKIPCGEDVNSYDAAITVDRKDENDQDVHIRMRVNLYQSISGRKLALRLLSDTIPKFEDLHLAPSIKSLVGLKDGLVLVTGVTGSGKTTTLASIIDMINAQRCDHIITVEQPVEYVFPEKNCIISQREVGQHTPSFTQATIDALREDPDIVVLGEMRDLPTMQNAITLAETGHVVFGTLHCRNAAEAVDRIVDVFPPEQQAGIRVQACNVTRCVISQSLVRKKPSGRYCLQEVLFFTDSVRNLLKQHKPINQVRGTITPEGDSVDIFASAIRGITEFDVDPYEIWPYMGLDDTERQTFIQRCEAAGVKDYLLEKLRNMSAGMDMAEEDDDSSAPQASQVPAQEESIDVGGGWD